MRYLEEIKVEFWKNWMSQVLAQKRRKHYGDAQVGDVVLVKNEAAAGVEFQWGRAMEQGGLCTSMCFYHAKYREQARYCEEGCQWPEN